MLAERRYKAIEGVLRCNNVTDGIHRPWEAHGGFAEVIDLVRVGAELRLTLRCQTLNEIDHLRQPFGRARYFVLRHMLV